MDAPRSTEPTPANGAEPPRRRRPPTWGIVLFLLLLAGLVLINQLASTSGKPVAWIENDLGAALQQAEAQNRKVFLYLYEPNEPAAARNELHVFTQRWARRPLEKVVCCRVALGANSPLRARFVYKETPAFLLLDAKGNVLSRTDGPVDETQFFTYIGDIASRS